MFPVQIEKQLIFYVLLGYVNQREPKLFEFSQIRIFTNKKELKMRESDVTLQWLHFAMTQRYFAITM